MKTPRLAMLILALSMLAAACEGAPNGRPPQSPVDVDDASPEAPNCVYDHSCGAP